MLATAHPTRPACCFYTASARGCHNSVIYGQLQGRLQAKNSIKPSGQQPNSEVVCCTCSRQLMARSVDAGMSAKTLLSKYEQTLTVSKCRRHCLPALMMLSNDGISVAPHDSVSVHDSDEPGSGQQSWRGYSPIDVGQTPTFRVITIRHGCRRRAA